MDVQVLDLNPDDALFEKRVDLWVAPLFENEFPILGTAGFLDFKLGGGLSQAIKNKQITGAAGECTLFAKEQGDCLYRVLLLGAGPGDGPGKRKLEDPKIFKRARQELDRLQVRSIGLSLRDFPSLSRERLNQEFGSKVELWIAV